MALHGNETSRRPTNDHTVQRMPAITWQQFKETGRRFCRDRNAAVAVLLGVALVPVIALVGVAADGARAYLAQARLSQAVDSAALAGGRVIHESFRDQDIERFFAANFPPGFMDSTVAPLAIDVDQVQGTVEVTAQADIPTTFLRVMHVDEITVSARAVVNRAVRGMELALVLDVTGSMGGSKIQALKNASHSLLDILYGQQETVTDLSVAIVPFASRVNFEPHSDWMVGPPDPWNGCGDPRSGAHATNDAPPSAELFPEYSPTVSGWRPPDYGCPDTPLLPLTAEKSTIAAAVDALVAFGNTRTDVGMVWGWRVLSPLWRGFWPGDQTLPLDYDTPLMDKVVILMTDGENTPWLTGDGLTQDQTNDQLKAECTAMKDEGIIVYAITFQAPSSLDPIFAHCATSDAHHFKSPTNEALEKTFKAIGAELSNLRISE